MSEGSTAEAKGAMAALKRVSGRTWGIVGLFGVLLLGALLYWLGWLQPLLGKYFRIPDRPEAALSGVVDVFTCCIFTWEVVPIVVPAFLLGGAVAAFVPSSVILRYLGAGAKPVTSYSVAAVSGCVLSMCSCNIVPLFVSVYRRGAGIGPAFTLLYAGPAINIVAVFFTISVVDITTGVWRAVAVPIIAVLTGILMTLLFWREAKARAEEARSGSMAGSSQAVAGWHIWALFIGLLVIATFGAWEKDWTVRGIGYAILVPPLLVLLWKKFTWEDIREWGVECWGLVKLVIPILIPMLLVIGAIASFIDIKIVNAWIGAAPSGARWFREMRPVLVATLFGSLMYFPILSEVAFVKAFLKDGTMTLGPALGLLLTGAGLSLPGLFIVSRAVGAKKAIAYQLIVICLAVLFAWLYGSEVGRYICACMLGR